MDLWSLISDLWYFSWKKGWIWWRETWVWCPRKFILSPQPPRVQSKDVQQWTVSLLQCSLAWGSFKWLFSEPTLSIKVVVRVKPRNSINHPIPSVHTNYSILTSFKIPLPSSLQVRSKGIHQSLTGWEFRSRKKCQFDLFLVFSQSQSQSLQTTTWENSSQISYIMNYKAPHTFKSSSSNCDYTKVD